MTGRTGFEDLTAATDAARAVAVTEELAGQIYLVTVVAVIISNLGDSRGREAPGPSDRRPNCRKNPR
jgi:hypothetical protein